MANPQPPRPFIFVGPSYTSLACNLDAQQSMNLYIETDESGLGKNRAALYGSPGIQNYLLLPFAPIRGLLATDAGRLFVVAGSKYYEVFSNGTYVSHNPYNYDVGPDDGLPVYMAYNGTQVMIVAGGKVWIDDGISVEQAMYQNGEGTVTVSGTNVTWISGSTFDASNVGNPFYIAGTVSPYTVASVDPDGKHLTLTASAGSHPGTTVTGTVDASGVAVTRVSGTYFNPDYIAETTGPKVCTIAGTVYTIATVPSGSDLTLVSPGVAAPVTGGAFSVTYGVAYSATKPVKGSFGAFLDGYFIIAEYPSRQFQISAINDGKSWNPADYGVKEGAPDGIVGLIADHEELWVFGNQTIEVWNDTGAAAFPLQRNPSGFIPVGCVALRSPCRVGASVAWLGSDARGGCVAYMAAGFIPTRVSTYPVETAWVQGVTFDDAWSYSYVDGGHTFWVLNFPTAKKTWCYDATEKQWHERAWWNAAAAGGSGALENQRQRYHAFLVGNGWVGEHIVGDWQTGQLYHMGRTLFNDAGAPIHRIRAAPHISNDTLWSYYSRFTLDMQKPTGVATISLDWSDDGGVTWGTPVVASVDSRVDWRRLGKSRDRVFRVSYSGGGQVAWINAHVDYYQGIT